MRGKPAAVLAAALLLTGLSAFTSPAAAAIPTEPTATVTVTPNDPTVDASGINPVDVAFQVNITGNNIRPQPHTMWVNISFATSTGWKVNPTVANLTLALAANGGTETRTVSVTVTVPPKVSANNVSIFSAAWAQANTVRFGTGQAGNATSQIHIRQIFSTMAEFANGTSQFTVRQGQNVNISMRVTNRGNGDALYDAELKNAADLRPLDVLLQSTTAATVALNGSGVVLAVIHANPYAIAGSYQLQFRLLASGAGTPPPAGAFADLTAQLTVTPATPPPSQNNTTQPPPPAQNNTTQPPPPPPPPQDAIGALVGWVQTPAGLVFIGIVVVAAIGAVVAGRRRKKAALARKQALAKARDRLKGGPGGRPAVAGGAPGARPGAPLPQRAAATRPQQRPGAPMGRPQAPPPK